MFLIKIFLLYVILDLKQFEQIYLGYGNNLSPIFNQTFYNVYDKLAEFETLKGLLNEKQITKFIKITKPNFNT